jgi:hypothetical protein
MFTKSDIEQIENRGITIEEVQSQIEQFRKGIKPIKLIAPATIGSGINQLSDLKKYTDIYDNSNLQITKFVPASGAASRMFKELFEYLEKLGSEKSGTGSIDPEISQFIPGLNKFAFCEDLDRALKPKGGIKVLAETGKYDVIIDALLNSQGLSYGRKPKGLLKFHAYTNGLTRTPFEEHLVEGALYAKSAGNIVNIHFTVSPEHIALFWNLLNDVVVKYEKEYQVKFNIDFSVQMPSTDTIAVDSENNPFYDSDGTLLFRPGGHGALIENLNAIESDVIFIKNIDNVVKDDFLQPTIDYKKALAGKLLELQKTIFSLISLLESKPDPDSILKAVDFIKSELNISDCTLDSGKTKDESIERIIDRLNRPLRVCGVVKNQGEPGGGPFKVVDENGCVSLQIVESSQVDASNKEQSNLLNSATHFNPVDLVCAVKDYQEKKFDLRNYIDKNTGFISKKSKSGREIKALELPGLWNGAMANWNTVFVEVPIETFNPVKTVNDLLGKFHQ